MRDSVLSLTRALLLCGGLAAMAAIPAHARLKLVQGVLRDGEKQVVIQAVAYPNLPGQPCRFARDLPLIAAMGANVVHTHELLADGDSTFVPMLQSTDLYWLAGFPMGPYYDPSRPITAARDRILAEFHRYASRFRGVPRLIGFVFGDDVTENYRQKFAGSPSDFYALLADAAKVLDQIEPEDTPLLTTAVAGSADLRIEVAGISFWTWTAGAPSVQIPPAANRPVLLSGFALSQAEAVHGLANSGSLLGGVYADFGDLYRNAATTQAGLESLQPRAAALLLAGLWGGKTPPANAKAPVLNKITHAAYDASFASPGALIRVAGESLAEDPDAGFAAWPLSAGTTCLCVGGMPAPLGRASSGALTAQVPWKLAAGDHNTVVFRGGVASNITTLRLETYAPGVFPGAVVRAGTVCVVSPDNGVRPGEHLEVYGTGFGSGSLTETPIKAFVNQAPATPLYLGLVPGFVGLNQINLRVDPETPPSRNASLDLRMEGASSNHYPLSVAGFADLPGITLGSDGGAVLLQAGGAAAVANLRVEGRNGYCGPVLFAAERIPEGITFKVPVAFTGQVVPLEVRAASGASAAENSSMSLIGYASGASSGRVEIRLTVLPNRGNIPVRVISGGFRSAPLARFEWNGHLVFSTAGGGPGRGINVLPVNASTGRFGPIASFDTWGDAAASERLVACLSNLSPGTIVLFAVADEGSFQLSSDARTVIAEMFGSRFISSFGYQDSWALIGRKGASAPLAEHLSTDSQVLLDKVLSLPAP